MTPRARPVRAERNLALLVGAAWVGLHFWIFGAFFPNRSGAIGNDYGYFLPHLLDGEYWRLVNGVFSVPWFTPAFCGGLPKFPNPQSLYFSAPQLFTFLSDPLTGVKLTLLAFGAAGYAGFYLFQRRLFGISRPIAILGAALFLFNSLFSSRMLIGHLTFHGFMLVPFVPLWLFAKGGDSVRERWLEIAGIAGVLAYLASHSIAHVLFQGLLFTAIAGLLQAALIPQRCYPRRAAQRAAAAAPLAVALCAAQLSAMAAFLAQFPRSSYGLAAVGSLPDLLHLVFRSLFLEPSEVLIHSVLVNTPWKFERPEFEYGVGLVPLALIALALPLRRAERAPVVPRALWRGARGLCLAAAVLLLALPLAMNYYHPSWHALLKSVPILANSSTLLRWLSVYVPVAPLAGSVAAESSATLRRWRWALLAVGSTVLLASQLTADREYYQRQRFDPSVIQQAFAAARHDSFAPVIRANVLPRSEDLGTTMRNTAIARGESQLLCFETLFGYRLENLPRMVLHEGPVLESRNGYLNLFDPSCFVFSAENGCLPGAPFRADRLAEAEAFASYRPFAFEISRRQRVANAANAVALVAVAVLFAGSAIDAVVRRRRRSGS